MEKSFLYVKNVNNSVIYMIAYRNTKKIEKMINKLLKKGHLKKNLDTGKYEIDEKGIRKCKKKGLKVGFT